MIQLFAIASTGLKCWVKPARDAAYRQWIKRFPCFACGSTRMVDPAHTGPHGISQKASDYTCIPLCRRCHDVYDAAPYQFQEAHGWNMPEIIAFWNHLWFLKTGKQIGLEQKEERAA